MYQDMLSYARKLWLRGRGGGALRNSSACCKREIASSSASCRDSDEAWNKSSTSLMSWSGGRSTSWRKEAIHVEGKQDLQTKMMIALFGLFAEVERDLISERTKEGLQGAKTQGRLLGRPRGTLGQSKLDGKEEEIKKLLEKKVSKSSIAKIVEVSRTALLHFIRSRKLDPRAPQSRARKHQA